MCVVLDGSRGFVYIRERLCVSSLTNTKNHCGSELVIIWLKLCMESFLSLPVQYLLVHASSDLSSITSFVCLFWFLSLTVYFSLCHFLSNCSSHSLSNISWFLLVPVFTDVTSFVCLFFILSLPVYFCLCHFLSNRSSHFLSNIC